MVKTGVVEKLHAMALYEVLASTQSIDNGTVKVYRNLHISHAFSPDVLLENEDEYVKKWGLIDEPSPIHRQKNFDFLNQEFIDWVDGIERGKSRSWLKYPEHWKKEDFEAYCYSERLGKKYLLPSLTNLVEAPESRRNFISIWTKEDEIRCSEQGEVPCTIGFSYQYILSEKKLFVSFLYRSVEIGRNFVNDLFLNKKIAILALEALKKRGYIVDVVVMSFFMINAHLYRKKFDLFEQEIFNAHHIVKLPIVILEGIDPHLNAHIKRKLLQLTNYNLIVVEDGYAAHYAYNNNKNNVLPFEELSHYKTALYENRVMSFYLNMSPPSHDFNEKKSKEACWTSDSLADVHRSFLEYFYHKTYLPCHIIDVCGNSNIKNFSAVESDYDNIARDIILRLQDGGVRL